MAKFSCEINSPEVRRAIWNAVSTMLAPRLFDLEFDGQWVATTSDGKQWAIYDGRGEGTVDGYGLEEREIRPHIHKPTIIHRTGGLPANVKNTCCICGNVIWNHGGIWKLGVPQ